MTQDYKDKYPIGSYWRTRGGDKVVVVDYEDNVLQPVVACHIAGEYVYRVDANGFSKFDSMDDLIAPWVDKKRGEVWVNVYPNGVGGLAYISKSEAQSSKCHDLLARVKVTWEEGKFDE